MTANVLTYSIATEFLRGTIGSEKFAMRAWSGGRRGATRGGAEFTPASYDVFRKEDHDKGVHGGPIPPGFYICRYVPKHRKFRECVFLQQTILSLFQVDAKANIRFYDRDDFFVHGRGPHGSDGCIVPESEGDRLRLNRAIRDAKVTILLQVVDPGMPLPAARATRTMTA